VSNGIEQCRLACGGHGYSRFSGLPQLYATFVHMITAEGEEYLLTQQTAKYLLQCYRNSLSGKTIVGNAEYLQHATQILNKQCSANSPNDFLDPEVQLIAYKHRATRLITSAANQLQQLAKRGVPLNEAWNSVLIEIYRISRAHCLYTITLNFINALPNCPDDLHPVLKKLSDLFALYNMEKELGDFTEDGYINANQAAHLRCQVRRLLVEIRKDAVALVDAFNFSDFALGSALGRYDGNAYNQLYEWAQNEPLNAVDVVDGYEEFLRPLIHKQCKSRL